MIVPVTSFRINSHLNNNKSQANKEKNFLNTSNVQFSGAAKVLSNPLDKAFVDILSKDLKLSKEETNKLKDIVWTYLRKHKIQSLGEHGGEDYIDQQADLTGKISDGLKILSENKREFINIELINRCDKGDSYVPGGLLGYNKHKEFERAVVQALKLGSFNEPMSKIADDKMYSHIYKALRLAPEKCLDFRKTVDTFLKKNNLEKIEDLAGEDFLCEQAELVTLLEHKFNLSEDESTIINWELISRANSKMGRDYEPETSIYVKDRLPLINIVKKEGFDYEEEPSKLINGLFRRPAKMFSNSLYRIMDSEAHECGFKYIFDIFKPENSPTKSKSYQFIMNSKLSCNDASDLVIKLVEMSENHEEYAKNLPKHVMRDSFYADIKNMMITDKIIDMFGLDNNYEKLIKEMISNINPTHIEGGKAYSPQRIAYELADKLNLPKGAESKIVKILEEVQSAPEKEADVYFVKQLSKASDDFDTFADDGIV